MPELWRGCPNLGHTTLWFYFAEENLTESEDDLAVRDDAVQHADTDTSISSLTDQIQGDHLIMLTVKVKRKINFDEIEILGIAKGLKWLCTLYTSPIDLIQKSWKLTHPNIH